jgi:hypothetical protein
LSPSTKRLLLFAALALAVVVIALSVQQLAVVVVSAVVAAVVAIFVHRKLGEASSSEPAAVQADPADEWIGRLQRLADLNLQIREHALSDEVVAKLEHTIDVLRELIPQLNEEHLGSELTWTVNRMASDYLSRILVPYIALGSGQRPEHRDELLRSLAGLEAELENIRELLRNAQVGEFKTKAAFLRARFLEADPG